ncbi:hypothetical protein [Amycolatopsis rubida]|uniref:Uncharacterized protein n=1 Tax=Amycolatopsis rubida TaxID=112413 RepID=A0A1I5X3G8_9PSEU|nr:hypothetical protein [Amycolatopsis rubida]SFQ26454.1 hypothetical protein SAMN05421854_11012 [Amycolatopsis rubida]
MSAVHELLSRRSDLQLEFVRHRRRGRVHVVVPRDPDTRQELAPTADLGEEEKFQGALGFVRKATPTLCGRTMLVYFDGETGDHEIVDAFADDDLCGSCHRVLGPEHAARAFEHPTLLPS